jgi:hypothetical protein
MVLSFVLGLNLFSVLEQFANNHYDDREVKKAFILLTALAAGGMTIKLGFGVLGGTSTLIAFLVWFIRRGRREHAVAARLLGLMMLVGFMLVLPWMARGVILSGYPVYPVAAAPFPVEWRVPQERAINETRAILSWARKPRTPASEVLGNWEWLPPWAEANLKQHELLGPLSITLSAGAMVLVRWLMRRPSGTKMRVLWAMLVPNAVFLIFWFLTAPNPRFFGGAAWVLAMATLALALAQYEGDISRTTTLSKGFTGAYLLLILLPILVDRGFTSAGRQDGFHAVPKIEVNTFEMKSGLILHVPKEGDQCWDTPLPCTPYPTANLGLRQAGDLGSGFVLSEEPNLSPSG